MSSMPGGSQQKRPHSLLWSADSEKSLLLQCLAKFLDIMEDDVVEMVEQYFCNFNSS